MKLKILFTCIVLCFVVGVKAQRNTIVNDNSSWATLHHGICPCPEECLVWTEYVYFDGDSLVADIPYKKVFMCEDELHENIQYKGLVREQDKKTYFIPVNEEKEYLLYDFSLEEGMIVELYRGIGRYEEPLLYEVKNSDVVEINGVLRKRLQIIDYPAYDDYIVDTWIEGVGSLGGFFHPIKIGYVGAYLTLLCHYRDNEPVYKNPKYSECYYGKPEDLAEYTPLLKPENRWNELAENRSLPPGLQYRKTYVTKTGSDTIINSTNYVKLLTARDEHSSIWQENGCIREDITSKQVFYKPENEPEILLYDFNAETGDKIQSYDFLSKTNVEITVDSVKHTYIGLIKPQKQMFVHSTALDGNSEENHIWIVGVGNMDGLLESTVSLHPDGSEHISLFCFLQNEELTYKPQGSYFGSCFVWERPLNIQSVEQSNISISPNPANDVLTVSSGSNTISRIEIFDLSGRKLYSRAYKSAIDVSSFSKGTYLLKVHETTGQVTTFKFMKK